MSLTQYIDNSRRSFDQLQFMDEMIVTPCAKRGSLYLDSDDISSVDYEDEIQVLENTVVRLPVSSNPSSSIESSYTSTDFPSDYSDDLNISHLMEGRFLYFDYSIPLPPPDIPPHAIIPIPPSIKAEIPLIEPEITIAEEILPEDAPLCPVCFTQRPFDSMVALPCCEESYCMECLTAHIKAQYDEGRAIIPCLSCQENLCEELVYQYLGSINKQKFTYMLVNAKGKNNIKACSQCFHVIERSEKDVKKMKRARSKKNSTISRTTCTNCKADFCFYCVAPYHQGVSCTGFQKGDGLFRNWMKQRNGNQANAHKCPKCKVPIQRISGCPNMTCSRCHTHWCYDCGKRKVQTLIFGGHDSKWSIFGCDRYKYRKGIRYTKMVRGGIFATEIGLIATAALVLAPILLALGPGLIIFGVPTLIGGLIYFSLVRR